MDTLYVLCAQLTRDLCAIAKFLFVFKKLFSEAMHKLGLCRYAVSVRLSVCLSVRPPVTFVQNEKRYLQFSPSHTILVFPHQTSRQYSDQNPLNRGVKCRWGRQKSRFPTSIWLQLTLRPSRCYQNGAAGP